MTRLNIFCASLLAFWFESVASHGEADPPPAMCDAYNLPSEKEAKYHGDNVCNRLQYNAYKSSMARRKCSGRLDVTSLLHNTKEDKLMTAC